MHSCMLGYRVRWRKAIFAATQKMKGLVKLKCYVKMVSKLQLQSQILNYLLVPFLCRNRR